MSITLSGGYGNDYLEGDYGNDWLDGREGDDTLFGYGGDDTLYGWSGNDYLDGGNDNDFLDGEDGHDTVLGGYGDDTLIGGYGDDWLDGGFGFDYIDGGYGVDTVTYTFYSGPIVADLTTNQVSFPGNSTLVDTLSDIENVFGTSGNDTIVGNSAHNYFDGGAGNDYLVGNSGDDVIYGAEGNDTLIGSNPDVSGSGSGEYDTLNGGYGADTFVLGDSYEAYYQGDGYATISDFYYSEGDKIQVFGSASDYTLTPYGNGIDINYHGDLIGHVENTTDVVIHEDFTFV